MATYQIRIKGYLERPLLAWFNNFTPSHTPEGDTILVGEGLDQAGLYGALARCRDLGMTLISVQSLLSKETDTKSQ